MSSSDFDPSTMTHAQLEEALDLWWALPGVLAGMPMPQLHRSRRDRPGAPLGAFRDDLPLLAAAGIHSVVTLLQIPGDTAVFRAAGFEHLLMAIPDGYPPSLQQFITFLRFMREQRAQGRVTAAHCAAGLGRTGTVLAGYLIAAGENPKNAIHRIRAARRGAIETPDQVRFLYDLADALPESERVRDLK